MLISWTVTLGSCLIWQIISFILPWTTLRNIATDRFTEDDDFGKKKSSFQMKLILISLEYVNKQNCRIWGTENDALKTSLCLVRILVQRHTWAIFIRKWAKRGRYSQWRSLSDHVEQIFVHKNWRGEYCPDFMSRRADVVWPPRSCNLTPLDYYLWGVVKDKYYADKPETIDALKENIREAIGEKQLHTIDNVLKNWTDRIGYCMARRSNHLNEIIFYYYRKDCTFK